MMVIVARMYLSHLPIDLCYILYCILLILILQTHSSSNVCTTSSLSITCCPKDYDCFIDDGYWRCELNPLGLTRGQKIGIGIGVTVAFFLLLAAALVIFCCCCRKAAKIASAAVNNSNNNQHGMVPPPVIYGNTAAPYDPVGAQLAHQQPGPPPTQEPKLYGEGGGYYHPQQGEWGGFRV